MNLLHLSFNGELPTVLSPRQPAGVSVDTVTNELITTEKLPPRVSFSPTVQQCFSAIYPNISKFFEELDYPRITFYVYVGLPDKNTKYIPKKQVLANVWDAHVTDEVCVVSDIVITKTAKIVVTNPYRKNRKVTEIRTHPFNDPQKPEMFVSPVIDYNVLTHFNNIKFN